MSKSVGVSFLLKKPRSFVNIMLIGYPKSLFSKVGTRVGGTISRAQMFHFVNTVLIGDWDGCAHLECCSNLSVMPFTVVGWFLDPVRLAINPVLLFCPCSRRRIVPPKVRATSHPVLNLAREALHELGGRVVAAPTAAKDSVRFSFLQVWRLDRVPVRV